MQAPPNSIVNAVASGPAGRLGVVTGGSFESGLTVRLDKTDATEQMRVGDFVVVEGEYNFYFCMISDMRLETTDRAVAAQPPPSASPFIRRALAGTQTYATVAVKPSLVIRGGQEFTAEARSIEPVRNIPMHFAVLRQAEQRDIDAVFGTESDQNFRLGTPLTMDTPVCIDLDRLVQRSTGVFGQSGTGKSVLTRILLSGIIRSKRAGVVVFDMHGEYASDKEAEEPGAARIAGLSDIFGSRVVSYAIDDPYHKADHRLQIGLDQIEPADIALLADELDLRDTYETTTTALHEAFQETWLARLLAMDRPELEEFCQRSGANLMALDALKNKLRRLSPRNRPYLVEHVATDTLRHLLDTLIAGKSVILQFGRRNALLDYMLVANILTRRIHQHYTDKVAEYELSRNPGDRPHPLVIVIEEAHKFLHPGVAHQTIFGTIAREMRKYYVTLLVVDQRPSGIDPEVLSQIGTRITGLLTEERDIEAALTGIAGRSHLRGVLASLETKQQCLIMGHAVPMPMVLRTRSFDQTFVDEMRRPSSATGWEDKPPITSFDLMGGSR